MPSTNVIIIGDAGEAAGRLVAPQLVPGGSTEEQGAQLVGACGRTASGCMRHVSAVCPPERLEVVPELGKGC